MFHHPTSIPRLPAIIPCHSAFPSFFVVFVAFVFDLTSDGV